jgi:integrase
LVERRIERYRLMPRRNRSPKPLAEQLDAERIAELLVSVKDPKGKAMLMLMLLCGLRKTDVAYLENFDSRRRELVIYGSEGKIRLSDEVWSQLEFVLRRAGLV